MRFAQLRDLDISNGEGVGVALFTQGCPFHCKDCFNQDTWDFNGGREWMKEDSELLIELVRRPYIKRLSILGGEPMAQPNSVFSICKMVRRFRPDIKIWIYSGYKYEEIMSDYKKFQALELADVLIDGRFETDKKDLRLQFRGSSNQRIIDVPKSFAKGEVVLWNH